MKPTSEETGLAIRILARWEREHAWSDELIGPMPGYGADISTVCPHCQCKLTELDEEGRCPECREPIEP